MANKDTIILFLVMLAVLCQIFVVGVAAFWLVSRFSSGARRAFDSFLDAFAPLAPPFAFAIATVTMLGSLYLSEVKHYVPCRLCWIQRSMLYPQVLWTGLLWWRPNLVWIRRIAIAMLIIDIPVSIYHYLLEWYPQIETSVCTLKTPCSQVWLREFGYVSIPLMALTSALSVLTLLLIARRGLADNSTTQE